MSPTRHHGVTVGRRRRSSSLVLAPVRTQERLFHSLERCGPPGATTRPGAREHAFRPSWLLPPHSGKKKTRTELSHMAFRLSSSSTAPSGSAVILSASRMRCSPGWMTQSWSSARSPTATCIERVNPDAGLSLNSKPHQQIELCTAVRSPEPRLPGDMRQHLLERESLPGSPRLWMPSMRSILHSGGRSGDSKLAA